ncbi:MAK10-like protein [Tanacetum coccineum]
MASFYDHIPQFFYDQVDDYTEKNIDFAADGNIRELSDEEAWEAIENFAQGQKEWDNVEMPRYIAWDNVDNPSPQSTPQILPSFKEYASPLTYPEEVEETLGILMEVESLDETQLEDLGLNTCNHDIPLSSREVPSFDEPEPQPNPLPNSPPLDISLGDKRVPEPPIKPHGPNSFRMKEVDNLMRSRQDGVAGIKLRRRDLSSDGVRKMTTVSGRGRLKEDLESSTWRRRWDFKATPSHWNDPRDFAKPVKAISLPQDVPSTSDRRFIELENQVQRLMEAHLALTQPTQVKKITSSCEICSGPHDTQYCMENPKQAFVEYASLHTDEAGEQTEEAKSTLEDEFQDLHLNLPVLKVLAHAPIYNAMLDKYVESLELGKNRSAFVQGEVYAKIEDPRLFTLPCRLGDSKPFDTLADLGSCVNIIPLYLFKKLNIRLLEETDHVFGLADGTKSYPVGIVKDVEVHIGKLKLLNDFYKSQNSGRRRITRSIFRVKGVDLGEEEAPYWTTLGKRESYKPRPSSDGIGAQTPYYVRKDFLDCYLPGEWEIARDAKINPFKDVLVFRRMVEFLGALPINLKGNMWESKDLIENPINWDKPPKDGDGAWHAKIRIIGLDGEEFTKTLQSIPTTRKFSKRESPREIINLDQFYDT